MHETLSLASFVIALAVAIGGGLLRYTVLRSDVERDRRFRAVDDQLAELGRVTHKAEVDGVRLRCEFDGRMNRSGRQSAEVHEHGHIRFCGCVPRAVHGVDAAFGAVRDQLQGLVEALARDDKKATKSTVRSS